MGGASIKKLLKKIEEKDKIIRTLELELKKIKEKDKIIMSLELKLSKSKVTTRMTKAKVREELRWTGEETNFAESVNHFYQHWFFPKFKFLMNGWKKFCQIRRTASIHFVCAI